MLLKAAAWLGIGGMSEDDNRVKDSDRIYDLVDVVEEGPGDPTPEGNLNEEIIKKVEEISEKVARQMFPRIAERIIKEEIEELKKTMNDE
jgi:hypothetical protein